MESNLEKFKDNLLKIRSDGLDPIACYILGYYSGSGLDISTFYSLMKSELKKTQEIQCSEEDRFKLLNDILETNFGCFTQDYIAILNKTQSPKPNLPKVNPISAPRPTVLQQGPNPREEIKKDPYPKRIVQNLNPELLKVIGVEPTIGDDIPVQPPKTTQLVSQSSDKSQIQIKPSPPVGSYSKFNSQASHLDKSYPNETLKLPIVSSSETGKKECLLCNDPMPRNLEYSLACGHIYHLDCASTLVSSSTSSGMFPAQCFKCTAEIPDDFVSKLLTPEDFNKYTLLRNPIARVLKHCSICNEEYLRDHICHRRCDHKSQQLVKSYGNSSKCPCGVIICNHCFQEIIHCLCSSNIR